MDTLPISHEALEPELSPLHNPILAENLDRWARVYAAASPENRTHALQQLLYNLKEEKASKQLSGMHSEDLALTSSVDPIEISCPQCGKIKEHGQKFCGFCGADFSASKSEPEATTPQPTPGRSSEPAPYTARELDSLRELSFSTIYDSAESSSNGWRYTIVTMVILLCLGAIVYMQWRTQILAEWNKIVAPNSASSTTQQANVPAPTPTPPAPLQASQAANTPPPAAQSSENPAPAAPEPANASAAKPPNPSDAQASLGNNSKADDNAANAETDDSASVTAVKPAKKPVTPASKRESEDSLADNGSAELATAQNYLNGTYGNRNTAQAASWLWKAVSKQNPTALVLLSDLYARGDGVSKNCDQARLLLVAAAKKGASDAGPKLSNFERNGCQ